MDCGSVKFCRNRFIKESIVDVASVEKCMARKDPLQDFLATLLLVVMFGYRAYLASNTDGAVGWLLGLLAELFGGRRADSI